MKLGTRSAVVVALLACVVLLRGVELKAALGASALQLYLYGNNFFVLSLLGNGFTFDQRDDSILPDLDMGYFNMLQLKFIYVSRFLVGDQFLLQDFANGILKDIENRLDVQFKENNWDFSTFNEMPVPSVDFKDVDSVAIYEKYVKRGIPFVVKNAPSRAVDKWTPEYFGEQYGSHDVAVINTSSVAVLRMSISDYVEKHKTQVDEAHHDKLYIRALSDIFDDHPELTADVGHLEFDKHMPSPFVVAQIFMGMSQGSGTSYHCANWNNLFFQINGRKKWTFVSPRYNALMYPMFNEKSMDVASFLTTVALADKNIMDTYYPLYKYAPKMVVVLEPGDVLFNPPWQWHMINNEGAESIGVATRWLLGIDQHFQNTVHSSLQFMSKYVWNTYYSKMVNLQRGVRAHSASNTPPLDERLNFGKQGSAKAFVPRVFPATIYD